MDLAQRLLMASAYGQEHRVVSYRSSGSSSAVTTTVSFSSQDIGTAASDRILIVLAQNMNEIASVTGITVGGTAMAKLNTTGMHFIGALAYPTGTTATIALTSSSSSGGVAFAVYSVTGMGSAAQVRSQSYKISTQIGSGTISLYGSLTGLYVGDLCFWCDVINRERTMTRTRTPDVAFTANGLGFAAGVFTAQSTTEEITATESVSWSTTAKQGCVAVH